MEQADLLLERGDMAMVFGVVGICVYMTLKDQHSIFIRQCVFPLYISLKPFPPG